MVIVGLSVFVLAVGAAYPSYLGILAFGFVFATLGIALIRQGLRNRSGQKTSG